LWGLIPRSALCTPHSLEEAQLPGWRNGHRRYFLPGNLSQRIELPQRLQLVAKELQPHGPRAGERIVIENAAAQGNLPLLRHLRLRFITLLFKPLDQIQRVYAVAARERASALANRLRRKRALQQCHHAGDDEGGVMRVACCVLREGHERFQAFADDIGVRQRRFVRQHFPGGVEEGLRGGGCVKRET
jgi:hypothetical protein